MRENSRWTFLDTKSKNSDGTHSLQRIHRWASDAMLHFSKSVFMKKRPTWQYTVQFFQHHQWFCELYECMILALTSSWRCCTWDIEKLKHDRNEHAIMLSGTPAVTWRKELLDESSGFLLLLHVWTSPEWVYVNETLCTYKYNETKAVCHDQWGLNQRNELFFWKSLRHNSLHSLVFPNSTIKWHIKIIFQVNTSLSRAFVQQLF